ncbi:hypothetical protein [Mycolicibacterium austroafricanum]|uniref:hypothetical protein n=1 Tax=Mycolicibacterium austroafricanum TaxID=39687 RepID=UPI001CA30729|nr:hypothetical protein [Mycolicibacterium austroafricanum]QZT56213.1 hypothetical protein JN084_25355 [Mycolicibacterium austroafricanum]
MSTAPEDAESQARQLQAFHELAPRRESDNRSLLSDRRAMLRFMTESTELCDCPRRDHVGSEDGHCLNPSIRSEEAGGADVDYSRYSECGCCMADCPDVHPTPSPGFGPVPGSLIVAKEHFDTLPAEKQKELRERESRGELRIAPQSEMRLPGRD